MKSEVVAKGVSDLQSALSQAQSDFLGGFYDAVVSDQPVVQPSGGFSQADIDVAVAASKAADAQALSDTQAADAKAMSDAVADVQVQLDAANQALADAIAKDKKDSAAAQALKASVVSIQAALDALNALVSDPSPGSPQPAA